MNDEIPEELKDLTESVVELMYKERLMLAVPLVERLFQVGLPEQNTVAFMLHSSKLVQEIVTITGSVMAFKPRLFDRSLPIPPRAKVTDVQRQAALSELHEHLLKIYPGVSLTMDEIKILFDWVSTTVILGEVQTLRDKEKAQKN